MQNESLKYFNKGDGGVWDLELCPAGGAALPARWKIFHRGISDTRCPYISGIYYRGKGRQKLKGKQKSRSASGYYKLRIDRQSQLPVAKQPRELVDHTLGLLEKKEKNKAESCLSLSLSLCVCVCVCVRA